MSKLYIVATPIGNLEDITMRAIRVFGEVDLILAEDKRVSRKLLDHYEIKKEMLSWHQHSKIKDWQKVKDLLKGGKDIALITDAGTPGVSDPGGKLIELVLNEVPETEIIPLPGPSSLTAIISVAGVPMERFLFLGYLPHKKGRQTLFTQIKDSTIPVVFFESVHRIMKALDQLLDCDRQLIVGRELTKKFETVYRGTAKEVLEILSKDIVQQKGEFVIIVNNR